MFFSNSSTCGSEDVTFKIDCNSTVNVSKSDICTKITITSPESGEHILLCDNFDEAKVIAFVLRASVVYNTTLDIADFRTITELGEDSAGKVILVENLRDGVVYALRIIPKEAIQRPDFASAITTLVLPRHPFIAPMEFSFSDSSFLYVGVNYPFCGSFTNGTFDIKTALCELCLTVAFCHENGFSFDGLQPENVLLKADGHIQLVEFGMGRHYEKDEGPSADWWSLGAMIRDLESSLIEDNHESALELASILMCKDKRKSNHFEEIKTHCYFNGIDWNCVYECATIIPMAKEPTDGLPSEVPTEEGGDDTTPPVDLLVQRFLGK